MKHGYVIFISRFSVFGNKSSVTVTVCHKQDSSFIPLNRLYYLMYLGPVNVFTCYCKQKIQHSTKKNSIFKNVMVVKRGLMYTKNTKDSQSNGIYISFNKKFVGMHLMNCSFQGINQIHI